MCNNGYELVGDRVRQCQASGLWGGAQPSCLAKEKPRLTCKDNTDTRGTLWTMVLAGMTRFYDCDDGLHGNKSRRCRPDGTWERPQYSCIRKAVEDVNNKLNHLSTDVNSTKEDITEALQALSIVTATHETDASSALTDGELTALSSSLDNVATLLNSTDLISANITENFMESVSNLLDSSNQESWKAMKETNNNGAENMLKAVDSVGSALRRSFESYAYTSATIIKTNVAMEVKKIEKRNYEFPAILSNESATDSNKDWIYNSHSKTFISTAVMYRDMSDILPTRRTGDKNQQEINGPVLSYFLTPDIGKLDPPIRIIFGHFQTNMSEPSCNNWEFGNDGQAGGWTTDGCSVNSSSQNQTVCECTHLTNFAVLMSPFVQIKGEATCYRLMGCWLSISRGVIWAFVAPALLIISLNIVCLFIVLRKTLGMKSMETKILTEKIQTSLRSLCVLIPLMGVSWIVGIFYINEDLYFMQYLFAICNGLQTHNACQMRRRRLKRLRSTLQTNLRSSTISLASLVRKLWSYSTSACVKPNAYLTLLHSKQNEYDFGTRATEI
ncbi:AGRB3-like protein [Mya arenaria]|uniref:AGRB3-like protein n=1 Tax=Mya arenaria TaxID=6604 RepID=A0ABY7EDN3_MYAAR|nr:AGRB3-like protein [Mya arenaria]